MRIALTIFLILFSAGIGFSQSSQTDSFNIYINKTQEFLHNDIEKARYYSDKAYAIALKSNDRYKLGVSYKYKGIVLFKDGYNEKPAEFLNKAFDIFKSGNNDKELPDMYYYLGISQLNLGNYIISINYFFTGIEKAEKYKNTDALVMLYFGLGRLYYYIAKTDEAIKYFNKSLSVAKKTKSDFIVFPNNFLGICYYDKMQYEKALRYSLENVAVSEKNGNNLMLSESYLMMALVNSAKKNNKPAMEFYLKSLEIADKYKGKRLLGRDYNYFSEFYFGLSDYENAIKYARKTYEIGKEINEKALIVTSTNILSLSYFKINNINEAYKYSEEHFAKYSEINSGEVLSKFYTSVIDNEMKKREIEKLKQEKNNRIKTLVLLSALLFVIIISLVIYYQQKLKIKNFQLARLEQRKSQEKLQRDLGIKRKEMEKLALYIIEKNHFLEQLKGKINSLKKKKNVNEIVEESNKILLFSSQNIGLSKERKEFNIYINSLYSDFHSNLSQKCPSLTEHDRRLAVLIKLNFSSKEIASILNITQRSALIFRYRLKKKLNLPEGKDMEEFFSEI
ncbi:MAG: tetratricopeptide repeat protein [Bacteroidales bacterium]|nr:tetratricopeptide repeat protein [Bacteroidales bacterium]